MIRNFRVPNGVLGEFVELLWLFHGSAMAHSRERLLPMPTTELVIDLRGQVRGARAIVVGPHSEFSVLETSDAVSVIGVHFKPGGAFPFFGVPAGELHNLDVSLDLLWGARASELREQILAAPTPEMKFDVLELALLAAARKLARHRAVTYALRELSAVPALRSVAQVTAETGMSQRSFIERFRSEVGMSPKLFARVQRFQQVVKSVHPLSDVDWAEVANSCGYFDQAHFIHDFREFSGFTPTRYFALKGEHQNHVPLPA